MTPGTQWTAYEIQIVRTRHMAGDSDTMIARDLGRKPDGVRYIREKLSIYRSGIKSMPTFTPFEDGYRACLWHLIDLMTAQGRPGCTLAEAKALYRQANEYDIAPDYRAKLSNPWTESRSYVGSQFAD